MPNNIKLSKFLNLTVIKLDSSIFSCFRASLLTNERTLSDEERLADEFFKKHDVESSEMYYRSVVTEWNYASDITDENERLKV